MNTLPDWLINAVIAKAKILEYIGYNGLSDILVEYDRGRLYSLKYLALIEMHGVLMRNLGLRNEAVFVSLEELCLEGVYGLMALCDGDQLPCGSLSNLKLLNVRNCQNFLGVLLPSNLLHRLQNLEILYCEYTAHARGTTMLEYVFGCEGLEPEQMVLTKLREITLCYLENLITIWNGPAPNDVFRNLNSLALRGCHKLKKLFTSKVAECLGQLELLWVEECSGLETVIEHSWETEDLESDIEESLETEVLVNEQSWETEVLVIPKLKEIYLSSLPQLTGIYSDTREIPIVRQVLCPSLEHFYVYGCPKLSNLADSDFCCRNHVQANDHGHFAIIFERLFHRQFNPEEIPQFFSKK